MTPPTPLPAPAWGAVIRHATRSLVVGYPAQAVALAIAVLVPAAFATAAPWAVEAWMTTAGPPPSAGGLASKGLGMVLDLGTTLTSALAAVFMLRVALDVARGRPSPLGRLLMPPGVVLNYAVLTIRSIAVPLLWVVLLVGLTTPVMMVVSSVVVPVILGLGVMALMVRIVASLVYAQAAAVDLGLPIGEAARVGKALGAQGRLMVLVLFTLPGVLPAGIAALVATSEVPGLWALGWLVSVPTTAWMFHALAYLYVAIHPSEGPVPAANAA